MINQSKLARQLGIIDTWWPTKRGTLVAATGFGKTFTAILASLRLKKQVGDVKIIVIVPTLNLQKQWRDKLTENEVTNSEVIVINTAYKGKYDCDLLILDEIHVYAADEFSKVFQAISYKYIFGFTATIERNDGKHTLLLEKAPVIDEVTLDECLREGWVSEYATFNLAVQFTPEEKAAYYKTNKIFTFNEGLLGGRFEAFNEAGMYLKYASKKKIDQDCRIYLPNNGMYDLERLQKKNPEFALKVMTNCRPLNDKERQDVHEKGKSSMAYWRAMGERKRLLYNAENKVGAAVDIIRHFDDRKALVFSESISFANKLADRLGSICLVYHSDLTDKEAALALKKFEAGDIRVLSSVKALSAGVDIPDCSLGISAASTSTKLNRIQREGRVIRFQVGKKAYYVNLYIPDTQEVSWLKKNQRGQEVKWIESIKDIT